jgi:hypothetical protein
MLNTFYLESAITMNISTSSKLIAFVDLKPLNEINNCKWPYIVCQDTINPAHQHLFMAIKKNKINVVGGTFCRADGSGPDRRAYQLVDLSEVKPCNQAVHGSVVSVPTIPVVSPRQCSALFPADNTTQPVKCQKHKCKCPKLHEALQQGWEGH